jgi:hypothetical protein
VVVRDVLGGNNEGYKDHACGQFHVDESQSYYQNKMVQVIGGRQCQKVQRISLPDRYNNSQKKLDEIFSKYGDEEHIISQRRLYHASKSKNLHSYDNAYKSISRLRKRMNHLSAEIKRR